MKKWVVKYVDNWVLHAPEDDGIEGNTWCSGLRELATEFTDLKLAHAVALVSGGRVLKVREKKPVMVEGPDAEAWLRGYNAGLRSPGAIQGTWQWACETAFANPGTVLERASQPHDAMKANDRGGLLSETGTFIVVTEDVTATDWRVRK